MLRISKSIEAVLGCMMLIITSHGQHLITDRIVPAMTAPSPDVYNLGKYGDIPISNYTGLPSIDIPLYTIKTKTIEVPLRLTYHAGAVKARDEASVCGLGWSLISGGVITQNIADINDLRNYSHPSPGPGGYWEASLFDLSGHLCNSEGIDPHLMQNTSLNSHFGLWGTLNYAIDLEPDLFSFNFLGYSGKFVYDKETQEIILLDQQNIKFAINGNSSSLTQARDWKVTLPDGTVLFFEVSEIVQGPPHLEPRSITWHLTRIVTPKNEIINYAYSRSPSDNPQLVAPLLPSLFQKSSTIEVTNHVDFNPEELPANQYDYNVMTALTYLETIEFDGGEVRLTYGSRNDLYGSRLAKLEVYASTGSISDLSLMKQYIFDNNDYFQSHSASTHSLPDIIRIWEAVGLKEDYYKLRLKLKGLQETISGAKYTFHYNNQLLPYKDAYSVDHWGFSSGRYGNATFVADITKVLPTNEIYAGIKNHYNQFAVADRSTEPTAVKAALLEEIHYPTGGYTKFEYESNSFYNYVAIQPKDRSGSSLGGGVRIARIIDFDGNGNRRVKRFLYRQEASDKSSGKLMSPLQYQRTYVYLVRICNQELVSNNYVRYFILESQSHTALSNSAQGQHVGYDRVEVLDGEEGENGREIYYYHNTPDEYYQHSFWMSHSVPNRPDHLNGRVKMKIVLNKKLDTLKIDEYEYKVNNRKSLGGMKTYATQNMNPCVPDCYQFAATGYGYYSARVELEWRKMMTRDVMTQQDLVETENYSYNAIGLLSEIRKNQSDESMQVIKYKFPYDYVASTPLPAPPYTPEASALFKMNSHNYHNFPVEVVRLKDDKVVSAAYTEFFDKNNSDENPLIVPVKQWRLKSNSPVPFNSTGSATNTFELSTPIMSGDNTLSILKDNFYGTDAEIEYDRFDNKGNLLQYHKKNNVNISFLWGYNQTQVIAQVIDAQNKDVFYTGFEDETGSNIDLLEKKTGNKSHSNASFISYPLTNLTNGEYILSYWKKNGSGWTYEESTVTVTGNAHTLSGLAGQIDDLRFYPKAAQMTTYTYDLLKGITSETDANNKVTYYEYDASGRLINIKDLKKNLLQHLDYNYGH
jgi:YD repeat-containing protein